MKEKYIASVCEEVESKVDAIYPYFDDPFMDYQKDEIIRKHIEPMMEEIELLIAHL